MNNDPDFDWLETHLPQGESLRERANLAETVADQIEERVKTGALPHTLGVFGGWGSGKTTFLAILADRLAAQLESARIIYFNAWKYAGLSEIVPSLIYKILTQGVPRTKKNRDQAALRVLASLGRNYSDKFGQWAEERVGVNPVELFRDIHELGSSVKKDGAPVRAEILEAYYTQVDRAQDALGEALGFIEPGKPVEHPVIVLIDELDRCDPDEAFTVIKQLRVLFAMRRLPTLFVVCANPEPIGLAIKHQYGLESEAGDYEARRILEKFVDAYVDFTDSVRLGGLARSIWEQTGRFPTPWIVEVDSKNGDVGYHSNTIHNATVYDMMESAIPYFSNLRVFKKTLDYLRDGQAKTNHLHWTLWHLELVEQVDPHFRALLRTLSHPIRSMAEAAYRHIESKLDYRVAGGRLDYQTGKGKTLFAVLRSCLWESGREELGRLESKAKANPQEREAAKALQQLLADDRKMNFVSSLCLLPFDKAPEHGELKRRGGGKIGGILPDNLKHFGWLIRHA